MPLLPVLWLVSGFTALSFVALCFDKEGIVRQSTPIALHIEPVTSSSTTGHISQTSRSDVPVLPLSGRASLPHSLVCPASRSIQWL
jgi:hypothetical protein